LQNLLVFGAFLLAGCGTMHEVPPGHGGPGPPPVRPPNVAVVHGIVEDSRGAPAALAEIWIAWTGAGSAGGPPCNWAPTARAVRVRADGAGYFRATLEGGVGPEYVGCVDVLAPGDAGEPLAAIRHLRTRFSPAGAGSAPRDTLRVDVRLP
jgi:hypothetical protein